MLINSNTSAGVLNTLKPSVFTKSQGLGHAPPSNEHKRGTCSGRSRSFVLHAGAGRNNERRASSTPCQPDVHRCMMQACSLVHLVASELGRS
jgi:hypothetical protein